MTYDPYTWPELALEIAAILNIFPSNLNDWSVLLNSTCSVVQELYKLNGSTSVEYLQSFPNPCTIPPASFFNQQGIAGWLEQNPIFKLAFSFTETFKFLYPPSYAIIFSTFGVPGYNPLNVPLCGNVTTLSQIQARKYNQQLQLFQKVYSTNSNAYITYLNAIIYNIDCTHMFVHTGLFLLTGHAVHILTIFVKRCFNAARCPST
jgi:hypothetical protein